MRRNDKNGLGDGFSLVNFTVFNTVMIIVWTAFRILIIYAQLGAGAILATGSEEVGASVLGQLGGAFVNLMYGFPIIVLGVFLLVIWFYGFVYIIRKELYEVIARYFRWGDL
jgi:Na+/H+-dicarboxylate symporter